MENWPYKNDSFWSNNKLGLKLPPFSTRLIREWKSAVISKLICLSTKWCRSYIVLDDSILDKTLEGTLTTKVWESLACAVLRPFFLRAFRGQSFQLLFLDLSRGLLKKVFQTHFKTIFERLTAGYTSTKPRILLKSTGIFIGYGMTKCTESLQNSNQFEPSSEELSVGTRIFHIWWQNQLIYSKTLICQWKNIYFEKSAILKNSKTFFNG